MRQVIEKLAPIARSGAVIPIESEVAETATTSCTEYPGKAVDGQLAGIVTLMRRMPALIATVAVWAIVTLPSIADAFFPLSEASHCVFVPP
jgi:hypothetical protein